MNTLGIIAFALLGGIGPALVWLWFWIRQDNVDPEPRMQIIITFIAGMAVVPLVYPLETTLFDIYKNSLLILFISWATVEEFFKLAAAYVTGLTSTAMDDPIDAIIYVITAALGFAALENVLFLYIPLASGDIEQTLITSNMRFVGANLLHVVASAAIGAGIALTYYRTRVWRIIYSFGGILTSIALHTAFNFFIMNTGPERMVVIFAIVWLGIIALIFVFQRAKYLKQKHLKSLQN